MCRSAMRRRWRRRSSSWPRRRRDARAWAPARSSASAPASTSRSPAPRSPRPSAHDPRERMKLDGARYLVRFDDICPGMNWPMWREIEKVLADADVRPMLAVVPANEDAHLDVGPREPRFWELVRGWQARGWTIGLHGYQHR